MTKKEFGKMIWNYYHTHGRNLPWRRTRDPYKILVSEVMLQQTQVSRVLEKYPLFIKCFPDFHSLSHVALSSLLKEWQGLGYNRRALALHKLSRMVTSEKLNGTLPRNYQELVGLPGIGPATAGAILAYAWNIPYPFIETNIRRVFIHHFFPRRRNVSDKEILSLVAKTMSQTNPRAWYWALMDYGTHLAKTVENPNRKSRHYHRQSKFKGSNRELRGKIVRLITKQKNMPIAALKKTLTEPVRRLAPVLIELESEGFLFRYRNHIEIA